MIANDTPILVYYNKSLYFPIAKFYSDKTFGGKEDTIANYKNLQNRKYLKMAATLYYSRQYRMDLMKVICPIFRMEFRLLLNQTQNIGSVRMIEGEMCLPEFSMDIESR